METVITLLGFFAALFALGLCGILLLVVADLQGQVKTFKRDNTRHRACIEVLSQAIVDLQRRTAELESSGVRLDA